MKLDADEHLTLSFLHFDEFEVEALYDVLKLRFDVFVLEQESIYPELDGQDKGAVHAVVLDQANAPVATLRMLRNEDDTAVTIGRVAVRPNNRGSGLGRRLMAATLSYIDQSWPGRRVRLGAQKQLEGFYGSLGFARVSDVYDDGGIPHIDMERPDR